jgi:hypothetical protein
MFGLGQARPAADRPKRPRFGVGVRHLDVDRDQTTGLEHVVHPPQRLEILLTRSADAEAAAHVHGVVATRQLQLMERLTIERGMAIDACGGGRAVSKHVRRHVDSVDVEPRLDEWHQ